MRINETGISKMLSDCAFLFESGNFKIAEKETFAEMILKVACMCVCVCESVKCVRFMSSAKQMPKLLMVRLKRSGSEQKLFILLCYITCVLSLKILSSPITNVFFLLSVSLISQQKKTSAKNKYFIVDFLNIQSQKIN